MSGDPRPPFQVSISAASRYSSLLSHSRLYPRLALVFCQSFASLFPAPSSHYHADITHIIQHNHTIMHKRHTADPASHGPSTAPVIPKDPSSPHVHRALGGDPQSHLKHHHGSHIASGSGSFSSGSKVRLSSVYAILSLSFTLSCYSVSAILFRRWHHSVLCFSYPKSRHSSHSPYPRRVSSTCLTQAKRRAHRPVRHHRRATLVSGCNTAISSGFLTEPRRFHPGVVHVL